MNEVNGPKSADDQAESKDITRREALAKLAKYSAYTAPTVMTLLASSPSMAQLVSANQCTGLNDGVGPTDQADKNPDLSSAWDPQASVTDHTADVGAGDRSPSGNQSAGTGVLWDPSSNADVTVIGNNTTIDCGGVGG